ncbi:hypothetical protein PS726_04693 [Pseudomonas fluorescens]|uniref:hypothetical protein n=1 Tax=Pseudomonas fluorescens TaxID=294 RepID=UPI000FBE5C36|nr:hypothetical protein [Pseudomonas fluorescens]VVM61769.1 hypothetical protein PS647_01335 [Pseudomonas fluorescens]VVO27257.1 hypothetical protein PS726_04693 [Pseudomonas fluorescens]VVO55256.1 hypothetical protein PS843_00493 [Pseudomonas fluorescens]
MATPTINSSTIQQLHRDVAALAPDMLRPAPTAPRATLLPFNLGAALALALFAAALVLRLS